MPAAICRAFALHEPLCLAALHLIKGSEVVVELAIHPSKNGIIVDDTLFGCRERDVASTGVRTDNQIIGTTVGSNLDKAPVVAGDGRSSNLGNKSRNVDAAVARAVTSQSSSRRTTLKRMRRIENLIVFARATVEGIAQSRSMMQRASTIDGLDPILRMQPGSKGQIHHLPRLLGL